MVIGTAINYLLECINIVAKIWEYTSESPIVGSHEASGFSLVFEEVGVYFRREGGHFEVSKNKTPKIISYLYIVKLAMM